jgi:hypothetical protein
MLTSSAVQIKGCTLAEITSGQGFWYYAPGCRGSMHCLAMEHTADQHGADAGRNALLLCCMIKPVCNMTSAAVHLGNLRSKCLDFTVATLFITQTGSPEDLRSQPRPAL